MKLLLVLLLAVSASCVLGVNPFSMLLRRRGCGLMSTRCKTPEGSGCCPALDAVCCSDQKHCCPRGFECNLDTLKCLKYGDPAFFVLTKDMLDITPEERKEQAMLAAKPATVGVVKCPDENKCPDNNTCCLITEESYGCCPHLNATCCKDKKHCCPFGFICDSTLGFCTKPLEKMEATQLEVKPSNVMCPDGKGECPDGNTCCLVADDKYGCCPHPNAVCCSDKKHCCPSGYSCDTSQGTCIKAGEAMVAVQTVQGPVKTVEVSGLKNILCPDQTQCADYDTCCPGLGGRYACCPLPYAVCCWDGKSCCPLGYVCNPSVGACIKMEDTSKLPLLELEVSTVRNVICPDSKGECADGNTCCLIGGGNYGCCPIANAVCCSDHKHCCPSGYSCDPDKGTCTKSGLQADLEEGRQLTTPLPGNVICPDHQTTCPDGNTCCQLTTGYYGCCPKENAVCCSDHKHCCPEGYTCDPDKGTCTKSGLYADLEDLAEGKQLATPLPGDILCPDYKSVCPNDYTCCMMPSGDYGCCPQKEGVCCADTRYCCPHGYVCNQGTCTQGAWRMLPFLKKYHHPIGPF